MFRFNWDTSQMQNSSLKPNDIFMTTFLHYPSNNEILFSSSDYY